MTTGGFLGAAMGSGARRSQAEAEYEAARLAAQRAEKRAAKNREDAKAWVRAKEARRFMLGDLDEDVSVDMEPLRQRDLEKAIRLTMGDRNASYGDPVVNMTDTARIFEALTGVRLLPEQVPLFMVAVKLARLRVTPGHEDSIVDAMAYLGIYHECAEARKQDDTSASALAEACEEGADDGEL